MALPTSRAARSSAIPFLPGNTFTNPAKQKFHKSQALGLTLGGAVRHVDDSKPAIGGVPTTQSLSSARSRAATSASMYPAARGLGETVPSWVAFDKMVLSFDGYFSESVPEARWERERIRRVKVLFYLEDDTMQVNELVPPNGGLRSGTLVRRHRVPRGAGSDEHFTVADLNVGEAISVYGKHIQLTDCDAFTADFLVSKLGVAVPGPLSAPADAYTQHLTSQKALSETAVHRNGEIKLDTRRQFLENDRKVLRFYCIWDDTPALDGDERMMTLHYYLATDQVEIREHLHANSGRDPVPQFLKPSKLPKVFTGVRPLGEREMVHDPSAFYTPADLRIGATISVFGRPMKLYDMDSATREWYMRVMHMRPDELAPAELPEHYGARSVEVVREIPPPTGFGSEADSLACMYSLIPKPPRRDNITLAKNEGKQLRFSAQFVSPSRLDRDRRFIVVFHLMNNNVSVFEPPVRNSGRIAGKFMEPTLAINPDTGKAFVAQDFFVGAVVELASFRFVLTDADEYALRYCEVHAAEFPRSDINVVLGRLCDQLGRAGVSHGQLSAAFAAHDAAAAQTVSSEAFQAALAGVSVQLSGHELLTLMRAFDREANGRIHYGELLAAIGVGSTSAVAL